MFKQVYFVSLVFVANCATSDIKRSPSPIAACEVERFDSNPIFDINTDELLRGNVNGPSLIKVPDWIRDPKGKFYLYFAHHGGEYIRLAYSDDVEGPWTLYQPGTLHLDQTPAFTGHIASPDVHIDQDKQEIRMYFHGPTTTGLGQRTGVAISNDGINFEASDEIQGHFYYRVWEYDGWKYAIAKNENSGFMSLYRAKTGLGDWEFGKNFMPMGRHVAVDLLSDELHVYHSNVGDAPERILRSTMRLEGNWLDWDVSEPEEILRPETEYEGAQHPNEPSKFGGAVDVNQLRDPAIFNWDEKKYLFYSGGGEETLNGARFVCASTGNGN